MQCLILTRYTMEGVKFQYDTLAALGGGILGKPDDSNYIYSAQLPLVDPKSSAAAPVDTLTFQG